MRDGPGGALERLMAAPYMHTPAHAAAGDDAGLRYLRSYLRLRFLIGAIGVALPVVLVVGELLAGREVLGSLSAYYYSGLGDVFVGACVAIGVFLATYLVSERNFDNHASYVGGAAVLVVAFFPTDDPDVAGDVGARTALHNGAALVFILALAAISFRFGWAERHGGDPARRARPGAGMLHYGCAAAILAALAYIAVALVTGVGDEYAVLIGEVVAVLAFGLSWFVKGLELFRTPRPGPRAEVRAGPAQGDGRGGDGGGGG